MGHQPKDPPEIVRTLASVRDWAIARGLRLRSSQKAFITRDESLIIPLDSESCGQFSAGAGGELNRMHSLRSSSALAYNIFAPWKSEPTAIGQQLGAPGTYRQIRFEAKYPTGVSERHPHLDIVIEGDAHPIAIESKYLEVYDDPKPSEFSKGYLEAEDLWRGLPNLRTLGELLRDNPGAYERLGAGQLVKHTLGLAREYGHRGFSLVYLWYEVPGETAYTHRTELESFTEIAVQDIGFRALTYQQLFDRLVQLHEPVSGYLDYLAGRYFPG